MAKTEFQLRDIGKILEKSSGSFQDPPMIAAPNSLVVGLDGQPRQLPDPAKTLKPAQGIERVVFNGITQVTDEKATDGRPVFKMSNDDPRVRFLGQVEALATFGGSANGNLVSMTSSEDDALEVTFEGTGFNLLIGLGTAGTRGFSVEVDGSPLPDIFTPTSGVISNRSYRANHVVNAAKNLTLGTHTIRLTILPNGSLPIQGFEILNEEVDIQVPQGEVLAKGRKYIQSSPTTTPHDSGFDGAPTLNGRGGRVLVYKKPGDETVYKAIQQVDNTQQNLASADHSNEEVIRRINWREFGANRGDDFSTLSGATSDRAFTLDDGTTTLVGNDVGSEAVATVPLEGGGVYLLTQNAAFLTLTFTGTGLDITWSGAANGTNVAADHYEVFVNGASIGNWGDNTETQAGIPRLKSLVSGLPYGTHTVQIKRNTASFWAIGFQDLIIYGPKKPSIPADAQEISDYYLMADYVENSTVSATGSEGLISQGTLRKTNEREAVYDGTWANTLIIGDPSGFAVTTTTTSSSFEYTFFGTGFDLWSRAGSGNPTSLIELDAGSGFQTFNTTNFPTSAPNAVYRGAGGSFTSATGVMITSTDFNSRLTNVKDLPLGLYTVRATVTAGAANTFENQGIDIITPIHFPNTKVGSLSMGGDIKVLEQSKEASVDLGKAKAWLFYDGINNEIHSSHNISAVVDQGTGFWGIWLEKPFKDSKYKVIATSQHGTGLGQVCSTQVYKPDNFEVVNRVSSNNVATDIGFCLVCYGELADEGDE